MAHKQSYLIDTNILIDFADIRRPDHKEAADFVSLALGCTNVELIALVSSLKDAYYVLCKAFQSEPKARESIRIMSNELFEVVDLKALYSTQALASNEPDYEDGLVRAAAESLQVRAIVSRDRDAFAASRVPRLTAVQAYDELAA